MIREMELLFQASRTSPMLHEAAVTVEAGIAALRAERDGLVLQNERLGNDIVAAEAALADMRRALEAFVEDWDFHACDYLVGEFDEEMRAIPSRVVDDIIEAQKVARRALAAAGPEESA